jgi:hypothetical protein
MDAGKNFGKGQCDNLISEGESTASRGGGERVKAQSDFSHSATADSHNWHPKSGLPSLASKGSVPSKCAKHVFYRFCERKINRNFIHFPTVGFSSRQINDELDAR